MTMQRMLKRPTGVRAKDQGVPARKIAEARRERQESAAEIAGYIAQLTSEMASMAGAAQLDLLAYFLSLARMEAETITRRHVLEQLESPD